MHGSWSVKEWITKRLSGRSKTDGIILILIGILVLIILIPTGDGKKAGNVDQLTQEETDGKNTDTDGYRVYKGTGGAAYRLD